MVRPLALLLLLCSVAAWAGPSRTRLPEGTPILIGPEGHEQSFVVERLLGEGGFKKSYLVVSSDPNCRVGCQQVVGIYKEPPEGAIPRPVGWMFELATDPHVRRESPRTRAVINGTEQVVANAEYFPSEALDLDWKDPRALQALEVMGEQLFAAIQSFTEIDAVHLDIKPTNTFVGGHDHPTIERILTGENYFVLGDHDLIGQRGGTANRAGTRYMMAPEILNLGTAPNLSTRYHESSSSWSAAVSLWDIYLEMIVDGKARGLAIELKAVHLQRAYLGRIDVFVIRTLIEKVMTIHAKELRSAGRTEDAESVLRLKERILNGLQWNPNRRRTSWDQNQISSLRRLAQALGWNPSDTQPPSASRTREENIARHFKERHRAWTHATSSCEPGLNQVVRTLTH